MGSSYIHLLAELDYPHGTDYEWARGIQFQRFAGGNTTIIDLRGIL